MSRKSAFTTTPTPESPEMVDVPVTKASHAAEPEGLQQSSDEYRAGVKLALEMGRNSMDTAVCLSCCALDLYKNACCFAPQLSGYFELCSRLLAAYAELQNGYAGLLMPQAEAMAVGEWASPSCDPAELFERSMDVAIGALNAQMAFFEQVTDAGVAYDPVTGSCGGLQQGA